MSIADEEICLWCNGILDVFGEEHRVSNSHTALYSHILRAYQTPLKLSLLPVLSYPLRNSDAPSQMPPFELSARKNSESHYNQLLRTGIN